MFSIRNFFSLLLLALVLSPRIIPQEDVFICGTDPDSVAENVGELTNSTWTLKILLVQFQDVKHKSPGYTYTDFNNLFFSSGVYVSPNKYSPDNQQVFGSMNDYLYKMSDGEFSVTGSVVNIDKYHDGVPDWLNLPLRKGQYDSTTSFSTFRNAALTAANNAGLNISTGPTTKLAIIYAGHTYRGEWDTINHYLSGLNPNANGVGGTIYVNGELFACCAPYREERSDAKFSEIGINVHEFFHLTGIPDLHANGVWDIMNGGPYLGPNFRGACPAPLNPQTRFRKGWLDFDLISSDQTFQADYNLQDPEVFRINHSTNSGNYWLIENRRFDATMTIGSTTTNDYNYYPLRSYFTNPPNKGVLVWRILSSNDWGKIIHADGDAWPEHPPISTGDPFPGTGVVKVLSPWSDSRAPVNPNYWYPNTKPSSNVGMEIAGEGTNYFTIDFYTDDPEDASPSKPRNLTITTYPDQMGNRPKLIWSANFEPDFSLYDVWRKVSSTDPLAPCIYEQPWQSIGTTTSTSYIDYNDGFYLYENAECLLEYKIRAKDNTNKYSVYSDMVSSEASYIGWKIAAEGNNEISLEYLLNQNYPNPFNPSTKISYSIKEDGLVSLKIFDILGREVKTLVNEQKSAGNYSVQFNSDDLPSGIYIYKLQSNNFLQTKKMLLLK